MYLSTIYKSALSSNINQIHRFATCPSRIPYPVTVTAVLNLTHINISIFIKSISYTADMFLL